MLDKLLGIHLSVRQAGIGILALFVGYLTLRLKLQGSALHRVQVALLKEQYLHENERNSDRTATARKAFKQAYKEYTDAQ